MSQLDNFRESLKRRDIPSENSDDQTIASTAKDEKKGRRKTAADNKTDKSRRATINTSEELHATLKAVSFWMKKEGIMNNPGIGDVINEFMAEYFKAHPGAKKFAEGFLK